MLDSTVVFNEIMYNPAGEADESLEWVELFNQMSVDMDLSAWSLAGGVDFDFAEGTIIPGRGFLVVAADPAALAASSGYGEALGPFIGRLSNAGEEVRLEDNNQRRMNVVQYGEQGDWPVGPDGSGVALAKADPMANSELPQSWTISAQVGGTPGADNFPAPDDIPPVFESLVSPGNQARVLVPAQESELAPDWNQTAFDDQAAPGWFDRTIGVGFDTSGESDAGDYFDAAGDVEIQMSGANASGFVRVPFEVDDSEAIDRLNLSVDYDDGFVAYLNGTEVARRNAPEGGLSWNATASQIDTAPDPDSDFGVISINLASDVDSPLEANTAPTTAVGANIAGVVSVGNWNDVPLAQQTNMPLEDHTGVIVAGLTLSTTDTFSYSGSAYDTIIANPGITFPTAGDVSMMRGHIYHDPGHATGNVDVVFHGAVPYPTFDLYVYYNTDAISYRQNIEILDSSYGSLGLSQTVQETGLGDGVFDGGYIESVSPTSNSNYVKFSGLSSASVPADFVVRASRVDPAFGSGAFTLLDGIQFVNAGLPPEAGTVWDVQDDFSQGLSPPAEFRANAVNPNGAWKYGTYGYTAGATPDLGTLVPFNTTTSPFFANSANFGGVAMEAWGHNGTTDPNISHNPSGTDATCCGGTLVWSPNEVSLGFAPGGNALAAAVWTAPADGNYTVSATFLDNQAGTVNDDAPTGPAAYILHNGAVIFNESVGTALGAGASYPATNLVLSAGDTLAFMAGFRPGAGEGYSNVDLRASISDGSTDWDVQDDFATGANPNGTWTYGTLGYVPVIDPNSLSLFNSTGSGFFAAANMEGWDFNGTTDPNVSHNPAGNDPFVLGDNALVWSPNEVSLGLPNVAGGGASAAVWTAPIGGEYEVSATFLDNQTAGGADAGTGPAAFILLNGEAIFSGSVGTVVGAGVGYPATVLDLSPGDTLAFVGGWHPANGEGYSNVELEATVTITTAPPTGGVRHDEIDISNHLADLVTGTNVLAIHGLNVAADDVDFLIRPALEARLVPAADPDTSPAAINEVASALDETFWMEIANLGTEELELGGYRLVATGLSGGEYTFPPGTLAAGGLTAVDESELGFRADWDEKLFLFAPGATQLVDARRVTNRLRGRAAEKDGDWLYPDVPTPGAPNTFNFIDDVVINEIMYRERSELGSPAVVDQTTPILLESSWKYDDSGSDLGAVWRDVGFDDDAWASGSAVFIMAEGWNAGDDFSTAGNPNGAWTYGTYGYSGSTPNPASFAPFNSTSSPLFQNPANFGGVAMETWNHNSATDPNISHNPSATQTANLGGTGDLVWSPNEISLGIPNTNDGLTGVVWTAPSAAQYVVSASFLDNQSVAAGNGPDVHVYHNGTPLLSANVGNVVGAGVTYPPTILDLAAGDVIHFLAGSGGPGSGYSNVEFEATIAPATPVAPIPATVYYRNEFVFDGDPAATELAISSIVDDGAVYYLNGVEVYRQNMPEGPVQFDTPAAAMIGNAVQQGPVPVSAAELRNGTNLLAVEVHQATSADADLRFGVELYAEETTAPETPFQENGQEWIELFNRGPSTVDLTGWTIRDAVEFDFAPGTAIASGEYLVVAKDKAALESQHDTIAIVGDYSRSLSNSNDRILLRDAAKNPADEVHYYDRGRWPEFSDGLGSSLELRDPDADNNSAEAWAASDQSGDSIWQTYTSRRVAQPYLGSFVSPIGGAVPPTDWNEFVFGLLDVGEVLIDDVSVIENPGTAPFELIQNGTFETDAIGGDPSKWRITGNHRGSVVSDPADPGNNVLWISAAGTTDYVSNNVETTLAGGKSIVIGREYEVSFRAKWLGGTNQLNNRAFFTLIPQTTLLEVPSGSGTPGAPNSRLEANVGPTFSGLRHQPVVPEPGRPVQVSVVATDPDAVTWAKLWWSANGGTFSAVPMTAGADGVYSGYVPGQPSSTIVQFYVEAQDGQGTASTFPAEGAGSRALFEVDDGAALAAETLGVDSFRVIMTTADSDFMHLDTNLMSADYLGATLVVNESEVFYDVGVRIRGSQHSRFVNERVGFSLRLHPDRLLRGVHDEIAIDRSSRSPGTPKPSPDEIIVKQFMNPAGGIPTEYQDLIQVIAPRSTHNSSATLRMSRFEEEYLDGQFEGGNDSPLYELEMIFTSPGAVGDVEGPKLHTFGPFLDYDVEYLGDDKEVYRFHMHLKNNRDQDDFQPVIEVGKALDLSGA